MRIGIAIVLVAVAWVALDAVYVVQETEQVIITQFGKPVGAPISRPGLAFKVPLIQKTHRFDRRFLAWDGDPNQLPTRDKRFIWVNTYARWRITDPLLFFQRLRDERGAQTRLDDILDGETRNAIAKYDLVEFVRSTNRQPEQSNVETEEQVTLDGIASGRDLIRAEILAAARARTSDLGIEILDMRFKRINYVSEVEQKVYERMVSERRRIADRFRSEGQGEASRISGERDRDLRQIQSDAYRQSQSIRGDADARATSVYAAAYDRTPDTRNFYEFIKTLETYAQAVDSTTTLLLSTDGDFYRYLTDAQGR
ncbi:protease modulator HflC [Candidatus Fermentibacteria bacterium]|nr:protease modulator HflC [Candidatus Fermentibacteria bacterium]